jgi:hypothetical protein
MKINTARILILTVLLGVITGCARITHRPLGLDEAVDKADKGIRYYRSSPYLIAYSNGKGGVVTEIKYLPDPYKKMSALPRAFMATIKTTMNFENGVLTTSEEEADAAAVPKSILGAVEAVAPSLMAALNKARKDEYTVPAPYIYKIVVKGSTVYFIGSQPDQNIKVTLIPQEKEVKK